MMTPIETDSTAMRGPILTLMKVQRIAKCNEYHDVPLVQVTVQCEYYVIPGLFFLGIEKVQFELEKWVLM